MKTELIKEFEEKHQRSRFLQDTGIGDMQSEQGCYCDEYVKFLEQKLANDAESKDRKLPITHVVRSLPSPEDVKRWYQLLIGNGEEAMYDDMRQ